jgi:hypothetical protein
MPANPHRPPGRRLRRWPTLGGPETIALALALFVGVFVLRESDPNAVDAA